MREITCPKCDSKAYKRNGYTRHGKQNHRCLDCGRQFSVEPTEFPHSQSSFMQQLQPSLSGVLETVY